MPSVKFDLNLVVNGQNVIGMNLFLPTRPVAPICRNVFLSS